MSGNEQVEHLAQGHVVLGQCGATHCCTERGCWPPTSSRRPCPYEHTYGGHVPHIISPKSNKPQQGVASALHPLPCTHPPPCCCTMRFCAPATPAQRPGRAARTRVNVPHDAQVRDQPSRASCTAVPLHRAPYRRHVYLKTLQQCYLFEGCKACARCQQTARGNGALALALALGVVSVNGRPCSFMSQAMQRRTPVLSPSTHTDNLHWLTPRPPPALSPLTKVRFLDELLARAKTEVLMPQVGRQPILKLPSPSVLSGAVALTTTATSNALNPEPRCCPLLPAHPLCVCFPPHRPTCRWRATSCSNAVAGRRPAGPQQMHHQPTPHCSPRRAPRLPPSLLPLLRAHQANPAPVPFLALLTHRPTW